MKTNQWGVSYGRGAFNLLDSGMGVLVGGGIFGVYYLHGKAFGLGDVKLAAAIGALKGWKFTLWAVAASAFVGGIMAIGMLIWHGRLWSGVGRSMVAIVRPKKLRQEAQENPAATTLPYAFAISVGTLFAWFRLCAM